MTADTLQTLPQLEALMVSLDRLAHDMHRHRAVQIRRIGDLRRHDHLAATHGSRRSERTGTRDNRVMFFGQAVELKEALDICDVAHAGAHHAGMIFLIWQNEAAASIIRRDPSAFVDALDLLREILRDDEKRRYLTELGAYVRWQDLAIKYWSDHRAFEASAHGQDPDGPWRSRPPTVGQRYMLSRILPLVEADENAFVARDLTTRGTCHDFIVAAGGNPRFASPPPVPAAPEQMALQVLDSLTSYPRLECRKHD